MRKSSRFNQNQHGFTYHFILPVLVIIGVASIGGYLVSRSHAATPTSYSTITVTSNAKECVDNSYNKKATYNNVQIYTCNSSTAQQWAVNATATTAGEIINSNGYCLNVYNTGKTVGTAVDIYPCKNSAAQQWTVNSTTGAITNPNSKLCLAYSTPLISTGTPLQLATCNTTAVTDQWAVHTSSSGTVSSDSLTVPTNLQVFTGGNNIALVWDMPAGPVQSIQVWRNNVQIATVTPSTNVAVQNQQIGKEYDDNAVTAGTTYQYKIRAVLSNGDTSAFTSVITATQPTSTQPVPTIIVEAGDASTAVVNYTNTYIVPLLKTWYPKDADYLAYPTYSAPTTLTIDFSTTATDEIGAYCFTTASGAASTITCNPSLVGADMLTSDNDVAAVFTHESTHSIQDAASAPSWVIEGGASFDSDFYARQNINTYIPHEGDQLGGYTPGAWFINYMRNTYTQNFPRDINVAAHDNTYSDSIISKDTGGKLTSATQAWQSAVNAYNSTTGAVTGIGGKCVEVQNGTVTNGTKLVLGTCNDTSGRLVTNATFKSGVSPFCLDDYAAQGTKSDIAPCSAGTNEEWTITSGGLVRSQYSSGCLTDVGGKSTQNNPVTLSSCTGGATQAWTVGGNLIKNTATGMCLTDPNSSTTYYTATVLATCTGAKNQTWEPAGQSTVIGDLAQQWALTFHGANKTGNFEINTPTLSNEALLGAYCMDDSASGTADGTIVQYWGCDNTNAQLWKTGANGTLVNVNSNTCLSTAGGSSANGTQLVIRTCDGGADQKWTVPPSS